jgi:hypothetical protein
VEAANPAPIRGTGEQQRSKEGNTKISYSKLKNVANEISGIHPMYLTVLTLVGNTVSNIAK